MYTLIMDTKKDMPWLVLAAQYKTCQLVLRRLVEKCGFIQQGSPVKLVILSSASKPSRRRF